MNLRNMLYSNGWMVEFEVAQHVPNHHHQDPYTLHGGSPNFTRLNSHQILPTPGSIAHFHFSHLPENHDGTTFYSMPQYAHQWHPATNPELGIPAPSNFYNPYLNPGVGRMFSVPQNCSANSAPLDGHGVNAFAPDGFRGLLKRNVAEGFVGNIQSFNAPASPSLSMPPLNACHFDGGVAVVDACFPLPGYRGSYFGQSFESPAGPTAVGDGGVSSSDPSPAPSYCELSSVPATSSEIGNVGQPSFHGGASTSRAPMLQDIQGTSGFDLNYHPPAVATSSRHSINNVVHHGSMRYTHQGPELLPPPPGIRIYRSNRGSTPEGVNRRHDLPNLRLLPEEGLAILEFPDQYETGIESPIDHHRDMRLDIDYMSYEELLALSEQIGHVNTGLTDEAITANIKTGVYRSTVTTINLEELPCNSETNDSCVICQDEYEDGDNTGNLDCGHEYHVECLKKWLRVKNTCPICKAMALDLGHGDG